MDDKAPFLPHAPSRVDLVAVLTGVGIMVGGIVVALVGAWIAAAFAPSPIFAPNNAERPAIAGPVQRTAPSEELDAFLREKNDRLRGHGVDRATGEAYVPIDEAMKQMAGGR